MPHICRTCSRANPVDALYCYHDGTWLDGHGAHTETSRSTGQFFRQAFVFPSGVTCRTFDELALACQRDWAAAGEMLQQGYLERFLGGLGRADLALAAREAARFPDRDRGLDQFLSKLPSQALHAARLDVEPVQINLGTLRIGQDQHFTLRLHNQGMRLLYGTVTCEDCIWLSIGEAPGGPRKLFQFADSLAIPIHVIGRRLRAGNKPLEGRLVVESNGGTITVLVRAEVPVKPFPEGALAGALSPRQVAEKAKAAPREAALLFEKGAIERWYSDNGWTYPVQGPAASGISAVQQFFEALGLTTPPHVEISDKAVQFHGSVGQRLEQVVTVHTEEKRPVYAHAVSDQHWLRIGPIALEGRSARIPLEVPSVPTLPGERLHGRVTVTANGNQRFWVDVSLAIAERATGINAPPKSAIRSAIIIPEAQPAGTSGQARSAIHVQSPMAIPYATAAGENLSASAEAHALPSLTKESRRSRIIHLVPVALLLACLLGVIARDYFLPGGKATTAIEEGLLDPEPRIAVQLHDGPKGDDADRALPEATMRFGLVMLREKDPNHPEKNKRLTYDEFGRSNNTCVRVDGEETFFGETRQGEWVKQAVPLHGDSTGRTGEGIESVWQLPQKIVVRQLVEIVAGEQSRLLDTCRVRYVLENHDDSEHRVGIRVMLDTFIGANDGVPFTIPGRRDLCDTKMVFSSKSEVPDFIQALEKDDLQNPGTVAQIQFKLGGRIESPDRVTLGAWPHSEFRSYGIPQAKAQMTGWNVPVLDIRRLNELVQTRGDRADADSCVVMYWNEQPLGPGTKREVGFTYGLGTVASSEGGGRLALTVGGQLVARGEFTLTALVQNPRPGEKLTLTLPTGFQLVEGEEIQSVPPLPAESTQHYSPVTWKIKAGGDGVSTLRVKSNKGAEQTQTIRIRTKGVFD